MKQWKPEYSDGYTMSSNSSIRLVLPLTHPMLKEIRDGVWVKFHKHSSPKHITLTTPEAYERRKQNSPDLEDFMVLNGRVVKPRYLKDTNSWELVFSKKTPELQSMPNFPNRMGNYRPLRRAEGVWSFALPIITPS